MNTFRIPVSDFDRIKQHGFADIEMEEASTDEQKLMDSIEIELEDDLSVEGEYYVYSKRTETVKVEITKIYHNGRNYEMSCTKAGS